MNNHLTSVIIPYYGQWQLTHQRMSELYKYMPENIEVILVNDASPDLDCHVCAGWWQNQTHRFPIKYIRNKENLGFGRSHNRGAKVAKGDILVFLSNDVIISGNFISMIEELIDQYQGKVLIGGRILTDDTGWNSIVLNGKQSIITYPEGWLVCCTPELWKQIGGFDPRYGKFDYEDVDLGAWALYNDIPMKGLNLPFLKHLFGQTIGKVHPDRQKYSEANRIIFRDKWTKLFEAKYA